MSSIIRKKMRILLLSESDKENSYILNFLFGKPTADTSKHCLQRTNSIQANYTKVYNNTEFSILPLPLKCSDSDYFDEDFCQCLSKASQGIHIVLIVLDWRTRKFNKIADQVREYANAHKDPSLFYNYSCLCFINAPSNIPLENVQILNNRMTKDIHLKFLNNATNSYLYSLLSTDQPNDFELHDFLRGLLHYDRIISRNMKGKMYTNSVLQNINSILSSDNDLGKTDVSCSKQRSRLKKNPTIFREPSCEFYSLNSQLFVSLSNSNYSENKMMWKDVSVYESITEDNGDNSEVTKEDYSALPYFLPTISNCMDGFELLTEFLKNS